MKLYLDTCCWGRPFDRKTNTKIMKQAVAITHLVQRCKNAGYTIIGSGMVIRELNQYNRPRVREKIKRYYYDTINCRVSAASCMARLKALQAHGLEQKDSM